MKNFEKLSKDVQKKYKDDLKTIKKQQRELDKKLEAYEDAAEDSKRKAEIRN